MIDILSLVEVILNIVIRNYSILNFIIINRDLVPTSKF